ncbi:hypothetical protein [Natronococcus pandeyae]|nr:hypothetical protein [Natronococcus pandeyae]
MRIGITTRAPTLEVGSPPFDPDAAGGRTVEIDWSDGAEGEDR